MKDYALFGGGCFWGVESAFKKFEGVTQTEVGYAGGTVENPSYEHVCQGTTGHAEVVKVWWDPEKTSLESMCDYFWTIHDPTQINRQGVDVGHQYRSCIDVKTPTELDVLKASKIKWELASNKKVATVFNVESSYFRAEEYHQDYFTKNPGNAACKLY